MQTHAGSTFMGNWGLYLVYMEVSVLKVSLLTQTLSISETVISRSELLSKFDG